MSTLAIETRYVGMLISAKCGRKAGNNQAWNKYNFFNGRTNAQLWPFDKVPHVADGIAREVLNPVMKTKRYKTTWEAVQLDTSFVYNDSIGRGAAFDCVIRDENLINPVFVDLKAVSRKPNFGGDKKIRLAGGSLKYCQDKLSIIQGQDNHPYLLDIIWVDRRDRMFSMRINLTKVYKAYKGERKVIYIRKHGQFWDLDFKAKSIIKYSGTGNKNLDMRVHHEKIINWLKDNGCVRDEKIVDIHESWSNLI